MSPYRLRLLLDPAIRTAWPALVLTAAFLTFIDVIIDPVALRGDRWFLGLIYGYPDPGLYFRDSAHELCGMGRGGTHRPLDLLRHRPAVATSCLRMPR